MKYILASASPRRRELLSLAGLPFDVCSSEVDETLLPGEKPKDAAVRLASLKAEAVSEQHPEACVIAADTIVVAPNGEMLGKPQDAADAMRMLLLLSGREHSVITGVCLRHGERARRFAQETLVRFYPLRRAEITSYIATGEPMDKAGAYGIQGRGGLLAEGITGDYFNVVGLPIARLLREMKQFTDGLA